MKQERPVWMEERAFFISMREAEAYAKVPEREGAGDGSLQPGPDASCRSGDAYSESFTNTGALGDGEWRRQANTIRDAHASATGGLNQYRDRVPGRQHICDSGCGVFLVETQVKLKECNCLGKNPMITQITPILILCQ